MAAELNIWETWNFAWFQRRPRETYSRKSEENFAAFRIESWGSKKDNRKGGGNRKGEGKDFGCSRRRNKCRKSKTKAQPQRRWRWRRRQQHQKKQSWRDALREKFEVMIRCRTQREFKVDRKHEICDFTWADIENMETWIINTHQQTYTHTHTQKKKEHTQIHTCTYTHTHNPRSLHLAQWQNWFIRKREKDSTIQKERLIYKIRFFAWWSCWLQTSRYSFAQNLTRLHRILRLFVNLRQRRFFLFYHEPYQPQRINKGGSPFRPPPWAKSLILTVPGLGLSPQRHTYGSESVPIVQGLVQDLNVYVNTCTSEISYQRVFLLRSWSLWVLTWPVMVWNLLKYCKGLVEENLRAPRTLDPPTWKPVISTQRLPFLHWYFATKWFPMSTLDIQIPLYGPTGILRASVKLKPQRDNPQIPSKS